MSESALAIYFRHRSTFLLLATWPVIVWSIDEQRASGAGVACGAALAACGVVLRLAAVRRIGRGARVHRAHASGGLKADGPYAWTRNPLYLAAALMLAGLGMLAGGGALALLLVPLTIAVYSPVVWHEEEALRGLMGQEYVEYLGRVPRWVGIPRRGGAAPESARVPWSEVLRREKLLVPGMLLALVGILAIERGLLPIAGWLGAVGRPLGLHVRGVATIALGAGAVLNSGLVDRKRRLRAKSRSRAAGETDASVATPSTPGEGQAR